MSKKAFFDETLEQSRVKSSIVSKYFWAWAKVIIGAANREIAYIDLYAGPGRYMDGTKSTPLLILEQALQDSSIRSKLIAVFNDNDPENCRLLEHEIDKLPGIGLLAQRPRVLKEEVSDKIIAVLEKISPVPSLLFLDPWGYKGLSLQLVNSAIKGWACECIFFFNYNRINPALDNTTVKRHMDDLFGQARADALRKQIKSLRPAQREQAIVRAITDALTATYGKYVLAFRFRHEKQARTSHFLLFVTKNFKGYDIMKGIMANESSTSDQGVPSFEYNPAVARQLSFEGLLRPLDELENALLIVFAGRVATLPTIYGQHSIGTRYIKKNYREALMNMERKGLISADPPAAHRPRGTLADRVKITFPRQVG